MSAPGELIAQRYRLRRRVGAGGMGEVWEAFDERLHRRVAVKRLHPQPWLSDAEAALVTERALREARITARLHHAHAVPVYDVVEDQGRPCLVMQFLPSEPLSSVLKRRGALPEPEVAELGRQLASALEAAHQVGIVHRDVKPGNVLVAEDGTARISDFGIAHALGDVTLTSTGIVAGTLEYLAPEVARGHEFGFAGDVFSLGATLYAASEGRPPFGTDPNRMALLHRVAAGVIDAPTRSGALTGLVVEMLATNPQARPTMRQVNARLAGIGNADRVHASLAATGGLPTASTGVPPTAGMAVDSQDTAPTQPYRPPRPFTTTVVGDRDSDDRNDKPSGGGSGSGSGSGGGGNSGEDGDAVPPVVATPSAGGPPARPRGRHAASGRGSRRGRRRLVAVLGVALLVLVPLVALIQSRDDGGVGALEPRTPGAANATSAPTSAASAVPTAPAAAPSAPTTSAPAPNTSSPAPAPTSAATVAVAGTPTAADSVKAISSYYALLPANTDAAWPLMTAGYQQGKAGGRQSYRQFWDAYSRVTATDVTAVGPSTVEATISYYRKDGRVLRERTSFGLVNDGGVLRIDSSRIVGAVAG